MWQVPPHDEVPAHKEYDLVISLHVCSEIPRNQTERVKKEASDFS
jgi:hypothetical protein